MKKKIELTQGQIGLVDRCDSDLDEAKWYARKGHNTFYAVRNIRLPSGKRILQQMHRVVLARKLGRPLRKGELVDHKNGIGTDNRRSNLRLASHAENLRNSGKHKDNTSGFKGVYFNKQAGKWQAGIRVDGEHKHLGLFDDPIEASRAYQRAAKKYHGDFARAA